MRKRIISLGAFALITLPAIAAAAPRTFQEMANYIVIILDNATAVLIVLGLVVYFYGVSTNILKMKDEGTEKMKAYFFWGIIVLFVMVSVWGIVRILQNTLFGGDNFSPTSGPNGGQQGGFFAPAFPNE